MVIRWSEIPDSYTMDAATFVESVCSLLVSMCWWVRENPRAHIWWTDDWRVFAFCFSTVGLLSNDCTSLPDFWKCTSLSLFLSVLLCVLDQGVKIVIWAPDFDLPLEGEECGNANIKRLHKWPATKTWGPLGCCWWVPWCSKAHQPNHSAPLPLPFHSMDWKLSEFGHEGQDWGHLPKPKRVLRWTQNRRTGSKKNTVCDVYLSARVCCLLFCSFLRGQALRFDRAICLLKSGIVPLWGDKLYLCIVPFKGPVRSETFARCICTQASQDRTIVIEFRLCGDFATGHSKQDICFHSGFTY